MSPRLGRREGPWCRSSVLVLVVANAVGGVLLVVGWWGASRQVSVDRQVLWANVAVAGVAIAGLGNASRLLVGRRAVELRAHAVQALGRQAEPLLGLGLPADFVTVPGMRRYHRPTCPLATARAVRAGSRPVHEARGLLPCGVCRP